jgi:hypothetical protein
MHVHEAASTAVTMTTLRSLLPSAAASPSDGGLPAPAESSLLWTLFAAARRQLERRDGGVIAGRDGQVAASSVAATAAAATAAFPGQPDGSVVVGAGGTAYQVVTDGTGTRVVVLGPDGQVVTTTDTLGRPTSGGGPQQVMRPDGALVLATTNARGTRSKILAVDAEGTVTRLAAFAGQAEGIKVGANGALYVSTFFLNPFSAPLGYSESRLLRISPTKAVRSFPTDTRLVLAPDGAAYLTSTRFGLTTMRGISADGTTSATLLPYQRYPQGPILGGDGKAYLVINALVIGSPPPRQDVTRLYTFDGAKSTLRVIDGQFGGMTAGADGVYLATATATDDGRTTTVITKATATTLFASDPIAGALNGFEVTDSGTVYARVATTGQSPATVAILAPDGTVTTSTLPGTPANVAVFIDTDGGRPRSQTEGYEYLTADGTTFVAVLNPDGTIARTVALPAGQKYSDVFYGPDGAAYVVTQTGSPVSSQHLVSLTTGTVSAAVPPPAFGIPGVQFGSDGSGYFITQPGSSLALQLVGFDRDGLTGTTVTIPDPLNSGTGSYLGDALVFAPDGTAYALSYGPTDAAVYALTNTGVTEVFSLDYAPTTRVLPLVVSPDGTVYLTTSVFTGQAYATTVTTIPAPTTT